MRRRRVFVGSLVLSGAVAAGLVTTSMWKDARADALVEDARARLDASLEEAPGLDRVQASSARSLLERAHDLGREDAEVIGLIAYARAIEDLQRGDLVLAADQITAARHRLGWTAELSLVAAAVERGRSERERAEAHLAESLRLDPDAPRALLLAADLALDAEDGASARQHLERLAARHPGLAPVLVRLGLALELTEDLGGAERAFRDAVEADGRDPVAWINLGRLRRRAGHHEEARRAFHEAITRAPGDADAHLGRGLARAALMDIEGARADFGRAAELAPNDAEPLLALGDLERDLGDIDDAVATYRRAIAREDADAASWLKLGNALALLVRYDEAASAFRAALRRSPDLAAAENGLGACLMHLDRPVEARAALDRAAALDEADPNPLMNLALLHERSGEPALAREAWTRALERDPRSALARRRLARL